jgi:hypothetical protein
MTRVGETAMRHQYSARHRLQSNQNDLFAKPVGDGVVPVPEWRTLPAETRQTLTTLMVRLILGHKRGACPAGQEEACHDD